MKLAKYFKKLDGQRVECQLCPHFCKLKPEQIGICQNKKNINGELYAHRYGEVSAISMDPIEKKPLYHFYPGREILSIGTIGCNLQCVFCQNYHLVEGIVSTEEVSPEELVKIAHRYHSFGISYTYNEPYISYELVLDTARIAKEAGLKNVLVTNGFYNEEPFLELLPYIDAMNIDLKSIRDEFYRRYCKASLEPVKRTIEIAHKSCLVELTNLIVTELNDKEEELRELVDYVASISVDIPLHFSRYHPMYKLSNIATPIETLYKAYEIARKRLNYVYIGNVWGTVGQDSICPKCSTVLVKRAGYSIKIENLKGNRCGNCGEELNFINDEK